MAPARGDDQGGIGSCNHRIIYTVPVRIYLWRAVTRLCNVNSF
uniref:Uncharacterized protein n=1 Tax=Arundo donax TaxID=35708 RepID=A0A0A9A105_ARUDO